MLQLSSLLLGVILYAKNDIQQTCVDFGYDAWICFTIYKCPEEGCLGEGAEGDGAEIEIKSKGSGSTIEWVET